MKLTISRPASTAAAFAAVAARLFLYLALDSGPLHNGAWLSALLGGLIAVPWLMCMNGLRSGGVRLPLRLLLLAAALLDGGLTLSAIVRSAGYLALDRVPSVGLALPVCLAALWCVCRNGDAAGYGAMVWTRLFPALLLLVILLQAGRYRAEWLTPIMGNGWQNVLRGGIGAAACFVPATAVLLVSDDPERKGGASFALASAALIPALLLVLRLMMAPTSVARDSWLNRLDALLTNGRAPLYLQLPMIVLWYAGLFHVLLCECFAGAALLQRVIDGIDGRVCAALSVACALLVSFSSIPAAVQGSEALQWLFIAAAALAALCAFLTPSMKGGAVRCAR